ncbi:hypothetical protein HYW21_05780 [Candidatus Woesearchaeota archaeon]|nr:hypothetical protein [Candidatus Woesearchaeota archaeon]
MKTVNIIFSLVIILSLLVQGCLNEDINQQQDLRKYLIEELIISFNGANGNTLNAFANSNNQSQQARFRYYFSQEINTLKSAYPEISNISIDYPALSNMAFVKLYYDDRISLERKDYVLKEIKSELEKKWYVDRVYFSKIEKPTAK